MDHAETIELSRDEKDTLMLALGTATNVALLQRDKHLFFQFLRLANAVNRKNPDWRPYGIPEGIELEMQAK